MVLPSKTFSSVHFVSSHVTGVLYGGHILDASQLPPKQDRVYVYHGESAVGGASVEKQPGFSRCGQGAALLSYVVLPPWLFV